MSVALSSCKKLPSEYNLGIANGTNETFSEVGVFLMPKGFHSGGFLNKTNTSWYMMINHWPVPNEIKVTFSDSHSVSHELNMKTGIKKNFRGDILITIKKDKDGKYYLDLKTGKDRELCIEKI